MDSFPNKISQGPGYALDLQYVRSSLFTQSHGGPAFFLVWT